MYLCTRSELVGENPVMLRVKNIPSVAILSSEPFLQGAVLPVK